MDNRSSHEIPGSVIAFTGQGGLPALRIESAASTAEIHLHGAHVTRFQKTGGEPLLFMSAASEFAPGKAIRGGVPIIFPWFGPREGLPAHGFARTTTWNPTGSEVLPDGSVRLRFRLPSEVSAVVEYTVTVGDSLTLELTVTNTGTADLTFENCLHTYFQVGDIRQTGITGLKGVRYLDKVAGTEPTESEETLRITAETDRVYQDTAATVDIVDPVLRRRIRVRKSGSLSTVVWNPWIDKSARMPDFGDDEYPHMLCVESGNVGPHAITLTPGAASSLVQEISSTPLD